jgi:phosphoribosylaminoimidazole-succinocarboxamide synthase
MKIERGNMLYEGKAKIVYKTNHEDKVIIYFKDDATAFNGLKKSTVHDKGIMNNEITSIIFNYLETQGVSTHLISKISDREQVCKILNIFKIEVIIRNVITGNMSKRLGIKDGTVPDETIYEMCYKNDEYQDPLINEDHALALKLATKQELSHIKELALNINALLQKLLDPLDILLVDLKLEFGKDSNQKIYLADEISPDTCRFWDKKTMKKLDKDRFRLNLGGVEDAYSEILKRLRTI